MIAENFWIYFIAFCLSGSVFTYTMEKLENFRKKLVIFAGIAVLLGVSVFFLLEKNTFFIEAAFMCVGCVLMVIMLHSCWDVSWSVAWYNMIWGVSIWEVNFLRRGRFSRKKKCWTFCIRRSRNIIKLRRKVST